ncbi:MAG: glycogen/starch synthase, partial [Chloroflexota bacterium]|nr:glycogen/starch synthase [Chloroflexota bacterium]
MKRPLRVLFAAAEVSPVAKVGGLADVAGSLPKALARLGHEVRLVMPAYASIDRSAWTGAQSGDIQVSTSDVIQKATIMETSLAPGLPLYLLENEKYFGRPRVYGEPDDLERFVFFSRALLEVPQRLSWSPDILHCHDWHAAPAVALLKARKEPFYAHCASALTIHNLAYQGWFDRAFFQASGMAAQGLPAPESLPGLGTMLGQGIYSADVVSTVSETYAREILTPEYGERLDPLLRQKEVWGIVNGIDYEVFNPATDPHLAARFDASHLEARAQNKAALQERAGLSLEPSTPLLGMVTRIADQKGTGLVAEGLEALFHPSAEGPCQLVVLGMGEEKYVQPLAQAMDRYPGRAKLFLT